jgi:hypothetical protein
MLPAVIRPVATRTFDVGVVVLTHGRSSQKRVVGGSRHFAIGIVSGVELHDHELLCLVITGTIDEAAARDLGARKSLQVQLAVILYIQDLRSGPGGSRN